MSASMPLNCRRSPPTPAPASPYPLHLRSRLRVDRRGCSRGREPRTRATFADRLVLQHAQCCPRQTIAPSCSFLLFLLLMCRQRRRGSASLRCPSAPAATSCSTSVTALRRSILSWPCLTGRSTGRGGCGRRQLRWVLAASAWWPPESPRLRCFCSRAGLGAGVSAGMSLGARSRRGAGGSDSRAEANRGSPCGDRGCRDRRPGRRRALGSERMVGACA